MWNTRSAGFVEAATESTPEALLLVDQWSSFVPRFPKAVFRKTEIWEVDAASLLSVQLDVRHSESYFNRVELLPG